MEKVIGMGGYIGVIPIEIPNCCDSYEGFVEQIENNMREIDFVNCPSSIKYEASGEISLCDE